MLDILKKYPFQDLFDFRRDFDEVFDRLLVNWPALTEPKFRTVGMTLPVDAWIEPETKKFYLRIAVPGIDPNEIEVHVQGNTLVIKGERKKLQTKKELNFLYQEFNYGTFERVLPLPEGVDVDKLVAEFSHGVLEINAPMATAALPRRVEIKGLIKKAA